MVAQEIVQEIPEEYICIRHMHPEIWSRGAEKFAILDINFDGQMCFYITKLQHLEGEGHVEHIYTKDRHDENIDIFRDRMIQEHWEKIWS